MVFVLNVHVQTVSHLGVFTINSSSLKDIRAFISPCWCHPRWGCHPVLFATPAPPSRRHCEWRLSNYCPNGWRMAMHLLTVKRTRAIY